MDNRQITIIRFILVFNLLALAVFILLAKRSIPGIPLNKPL